MASSGLPETDYDRQRVQALLDRLREDERAWNFFPEEHMRDVKDAGTSLKDW